MAPRSVKARGEFVWVQYGIGNDPKGLKPAQLVVPMSEMTMGRMKPDDEVEIMLTSSQLIRTVLHGQIDYTQERVERGRKSRTPTRQSNKRKSLEQTAAEIAKKSPAPERTFIERRGKSESPAKKSSPAKKATPKKTPSKSPPKMSPVPAKKAPASAKKPVTRSPKQAPVPVEKPAARSPPKQAAVPVKKPAAKSPKEAPPATAKPTPKKAASTIKTPPKPTVTTSKTPSKKITPKTTSVIARSPKKSTAKSSGSKVSDMTLAAGFIKDQNYQLQRSKHNDKLGPDLYRMVEDASMYGFGDLVMWSKYREVDAIFLPNKHKFITQILHNCKDCNYKNFESFRKSLSEFGFVIYGNSREKEEGPAFIVHQYLVKGKPQLAKRIDNKSADNPSPPTTTTAPVPKPKSTSTPAKKSAPPKSSAVKKTPTPKPATPSTKTATPKSSAVKKTPTSKSAAAAKKPATSKPAAKRKAAAKAPPVAPPRSPYVAKVKAATGATIVKYPTSIPVIEEDRNEPPPIVSTAAAPPVEEESSEPPAKRQKMNSPEEEASILGTLTAPFKSVGNFVASEITGFYHGIFRGHGGYGESSS